MSKVKLIFGTCNAIPSGETDLHFEDAYQKAFKPFITAIYNHPEILSTLYYTGSLLEWMEKKHPEFHVVLGELVTRKKIEILSGGYWEPMLPLIPTPDKVGQIEVMTNYLRKKFGKRSRGGWIPGQIWEMHLASSLHASGMDYVFLSERAFPRIQETCPNAPVIAENQGKTVLVFPIMESLTDQFLRVPPERILSSLENLETGRNREAVATLMLDGLTLGADGLRKICYEEKWLENFFDAVARAGDWLECVHPGRYLRNTDLPRGKVYIPALTYDALMHWSQGNQSNQSNPSSSTVSGSSNDEAGEFTRNRSKFSYRNFLAIYRESELLYSKMMHVGVLSNQLRGDKYRKRNAKEELWRGQEHYAYWHGPSGGIYNSRLRHSTYSALIEAEKATRERGIFKAALTSLDFDMDGNKEYLYNGLSFNAYIHLVGGALFELDYLPVSRNYLATFSRYRESYHSRETVKRGYDSYPRHAFLDHILDPSVKLADFERGLYHRLGDFPTKRYRTLNLEREPPRVSLACSAALNGEEKALDIYKTFSFRRGLLAVDYKLTNLSQGKLTFLWGSEINLALAENAEMRSVFLNADEAAADGVQERGSDKGVNSWTVLDKALGVAINFQLSETAELWKSPFFADYRVGGELRRNYQSNFFMPRWLIVLEPEAARSLKITMKIGRHRSR